MLRLRHLAAIALVSSAFAARPAQADDEGPDHAACFQKRLYDACFREGKARYGADAYDEAYAAYLEGFKLKPNYEVAGNLGNVELKLEKYAAAYTHLKYSLENLPPSQRGGDVENRLEEKIGEALQHVGGRRFDTDPPGSEVTIDGNPVDSSSLGMWIGIEPGERKLVVSKPGYTTVERTLDIRAGSEEATSIVLVPAAEGPDPAPKTAETGPELSLPLVIIGGVVFAGAVGAGIGLHVAAAGKADDREAVTATIPDPGACSGNPTGDLAARCQQVSELADQENTFSNAGTGLLIGGIAVGAAVGIYAIVVLTSGPSDETEPDTASVTLVPSFGPTENGVTLLGRF